jgi:hypothetical protein
MRTRKVLILLFWLNLSFNAKYAVVEKVEGHVVMSIRSYVLHSGRAHTRKHFSGHAYVCSVRVTQGTLVNTSVVMPTYALCMLNAACLYYE